MGRTVIVGDVHGCTSELEALLGEVDFDSARDRLIFVGDLVSRGPDSHGTLALARRLGARVVRGNHEHRLVTHRDETGAAHGKRLGPGHERLAREFSADEWTMLAAMPFWVDLPRHGVRVVHAGVVPGIEFDRVPSEALLRMRTIDQRGRWSDESDAGPLWGTRYEGPPHVIFGHNARAEPQLHAWATGIDTGCVYGGRLTAVVLGEGELMPRGEAARSTLRSVVALRRHHGGEDRPLSR